MINFSDGISHLYLRGLSEVTHDIKTGLNDWLVDGKEYFAIQDQLINDFTISTFDMNTFFRPYAYDINRLSCAAMESLNDIQPNTLSPKFFGWAITKYYYSAFFSAHSILKMTGNSISNINHLSINKVCELSRTRGYSANNLNSGLYSMAINPANNTFRFFKDKQYDDSHQGLWLRFLHFLESSKAGINGQLLQEDAELVVAKIDELILALKNWNSLKGSWLSKIRNQANYSQDFGIWYPYKNFKKEITDVQKFISLCKNDPMAIDIQSYRGMDLIYFVRTCQLINSINFNIQSDLMKKHSMNKSFVKSGIFAYQNKYLNKSEHNTGFVKS